MDRVKKPVIVFPFVEAGLGHIMPMRAIADAFEKKYGDKAEVIRTYFFQYKSNADMKFVEDELIKEVKIHNKRKGWGSLQFLLMRIFGTRFSMRYVMEKRYKRGFQPSLDYIKELNADLIFNTHFSTLYYSCEAKARGLINPDIITYCPDPIIGLQWDNRGDIIALSSTVGKEKAQKEKRFRNTEIVEVPFLIRSEIKDYTESKEYYRRELDLPEDKFTILVADGAYGVGKIRKTVYELFKTSKELTIIAVCGKNEELYKEFLGIKDIPKNITFAPYGFTDKTLMLAAASDLFIGKAGASNLAEPVYFGSPAITTFCATPIEKWISAHFERAGCAVKITNIKKAAALACHFADEPKVLKSLKDNCKKLRRADGAEILADILWDKLRSKEFKE